MSLPELDGLDTARGLSFCAGRVEPYLRLLGQFASLYGGGLPKVDAWLAGGDSTAARNELHAMGGAAATLGAAGLEAGVRSAEALMRRAPDGTAARAAGTELRDQLAALVAELKRQLEAAGRADADRR